MMGSKIDRAIATLSRLRGEAKADAGGLDVVFHVPGSIVAPNHIGIRTGRLSKRERLMQVQIAVPRDVLEQDEHEILGYLLASLREAVRVAATAFRRAKVPYDEEEDLMLLKRIESACIH